MEAASSKPRPGKMSQKVTCSLTATQSQRNCAATFHPVSSKTTRPRQLHRRGRGTGTISSTCLGGTLQYRRPYAAHVMRPVAFGYAARVPPNKGAAYRMLVRSDAAIYCLTQSVSATI